MPTRVSYRQIGEVLVDVEERSTRDVSGEIELAPAAWVAELPAAVDELDTGAWRALKTLPVCEVDLHRSAIVARAASARPS
jgi:hypothetical protein